MSIPLEIITFVLDEQRYALPSVLVQELARAVEIISFPGAAKGVEGVINYRGNIVPVLDLRQYLGLTPRALQPTDYLIILRRQHGLSAIRVDRALDVCRIALPKDEEGLGDDGRSAVVHAQDGSVIVVNLRPLLTGLEDPISQSRTDASASHARVSHG